MAFTHFCDTCSYFKEKALGPNQKIGYKGECRRYAPYGQGSTFPSVNTDDWCGEHPKNSLPLDMVLMEHEDPDHNTIEGFATQMDKFSPTRRQGM